jgi:predicted nucleotidyltransferase
MFQQLLETIALSLEKRGIPYMVIGGQAVLLYGEPRLTRDIDVTLGIGPERVQEIAGLAAEQGWKLLTDSPAEFVAKSLVLPCLEPASGVRVDFIFSFSAYERQAIDRVRRVPMGQALVSFAAIEDLIIHKVVAGRPRDIDDVKCILLKNPHVDFPYVRHWLGEFDRSLSEAFSQRFELVRKSALPTS